MAKPRSLGPTSYSVLVTLAFDRAVLYGNVAFSTAYFQLKDGTPVFITQKNCFKVKAVKTFKISCDCHIKIGRSIKWRVNFEIPSAAFRGTYVTPLGFKMRPLIVILR